MYNTPKKMSKKKKIELTILICILIWVIFFLIDYFRYTDRKHPIFGLPVTKKYSDGVIKQWYCLGYVYRSYERNSIQKIELVPIWSPITKVPESPNVPVTHKDYPVPSNPGREDVFRGLLYFYSDRGKLLGTYKCINTDSSCNKAYGGWDEYNIINNDPVTKTDQHKIKVLYDKYAFLEDSFEQNGKYGDDDYHRMIYLFDIEKNKILSKYSDIKESTYDKYYELASGDDYMYIVKDHEHEKWGIIKIEENGEIKEVLPFEYDSINYDTDTSYYILAKDNSWYVYDLKNGKEISNHNNEVIFDVFLNDNQTYYYKTGIKRIVGEESFFNYKIYNIDGNVFMDTDNVTTIMFRGTYYMYITSNDCFLHFADYSKEEHKKIKLAFWQMDYDKKTHPAFVINSEKNNFISLHVYDGRELKYSYHYESLNTKEWY